MASQYIDREKVRAAIRRMGSEYVFYMLDDAITLLPQTKLRRLIKQLCLAKRSYACEISDLEYSLIRSFPLRFLP